MAALPSVPGPKLKPFNEDGKQPNIEFLRFLGNGVHAHVWKVRINGDLFALKIYILGRHFTPSSFFEVELNDEDQIAYMHPFNCESRAYGRLQEKGMERLAVQCHGYLMLDEEHEKLLRQAMSREKDKCDWEVFWDGNDDIKGNPLQALVKEYVEYPAVVEGESIHDAERREVNFAVDGPKTARKLIRAIKSVHGIGILVRDIHYPNVVGGRLLEFSCSWTVPHPCLSTEQIEDKIAPVSQLGRTDATGVDDVIRIWNHYHAPKKIWERAGPSIDYLRRLRSHAQYVGTTRIPWNWNRGYRHRPDKYKWKPDLKEEAPSRKVSKRTKRPKR